MILSDRQIRDAVGLGDIVISPYDSRSLGPNSYDVRLSRHIAWYRSPYLDPREDNEVEHLELKHDEPFELHPGTLYLGSTAEVVGSRKYVPWLDGKSSIGRLGIFIHVTAGRGDVGFVNHWTLEIVAVQRVVVYAGMPIGQFSFFQSGPVDDSYDQRSSSKYNERSPKPQPSAMWKNFK